jgi:predicted metal-binding membrane protein
MAAQLRSTENFLGWWRPHSLFGKARRNLLLSLLVLTCGAWALTLYYAVEMGAPVGTAMTGGMSADAMAGMESMAGMAMGGMSAAGWSFSGAVVFVAIWTVMMAAMMLPAAAPMIMIFASAPARRGQAAFVPTWIFVAGYLLVWLMAGVIVYVIIEIATETANHLGSVEKGAWAPIALGIILIMAGVYQFTPIKRVCLRHCRSPFAFVAMHWRDGRLGAVQMGVVHGIFCLGCCWALFAVLVAAGTMSLAWMLALTLVVFAEKVLPMARFISPAIGIALVILGLALSVSAV